jgi:hypothetical protein
MSQGQSRLAALFGARRRHRRHVAATSLKSRRGPAHVPGPQTDIPGDSLSNAPNGTNPCKSAPDEDNADMTTPNFSLRPQTSQERTSTAIGAVAHRRTAAPAESRRLRDRLHRVANAGQRCRLGLCCGHLGQPARSRYDRSVSQDRLSESIRGQGT